MGVENFLFLSSPGECRTFFLPSEADQPSDQVDECVDGASVSGVLNLADVFELVIDGFNQGPLPEKDFVHQVQQLGFHVLA